MVAEEKRPVKEDLYAIGRIRKCSGVKGELVVESMTPNAHRFSQLDRVFIGHDAREVRLNAVCIESTRPHRRGIVVKLKGIDDRNRAEEVLGHYLFVLREERITLPPETYFVDDILGLRVEDEDGARIGTVIDVLRLPAHDVYVVKQKGREFWIPSVREIIRSVDLRKRLLKIHVIEGLLESQQLGRSVE